MKFLFVLIALFGIIVATVHAADKSVCSLPKQVGPCRKAVHNFYYNSESNECEHFIYGGCKGNENRFDSKEDCEKTCK